MEALPEAVHKAVLRVQAESHGPQDLRVPLAQVVKGVHQLLQVRVGVDHVGRQDVVETVCGVWEALLNVWTPDELRHLHTDTGCYIKGRHGGALANNVASQWQI